MSVAFYIGVKKIHIYQLIGSDWNDLLCGQCLVCFSGFLMFLIGLFIGRYLTVLFTDCHACFSVFVVEFFFVYGHCVSYWFVLLQCMNSLSRGDVVKAGFLTHERCKHKTCGEQSLKPRWYLRAEFRSNAGIFFKFFSYIGHNIALLILNLRSVWHI